MHTSPSVLAALPRRTRRILEVGWAVVLLKCLATPWVIAHWQIPVHPAWVIAPTIVFAVLITLLVWTASAES